MDKKGILKNNLYLLRAEKRMTQMEVAEKLGVSRQTVVSIENNKYNPSLKLAFRIANLFGKDVSDVFTYIEEAPCQQGGFLSRLDSLPLSYILLCMLGLLG